MKKILLILAIATISCNDRVQVTRNQRYQVDGDYFSEVVIDDCQYIIISGHSITHKGNCTNHNR